MSTTTRLGVLDIGSNTVHLAVVDAAYAARPVQAAGARTVVRIMRYLRPDGSLSPEGVAAMLAAVDDAMALARESDVDEMLPMATSALRDATNGPEVLAAIGERVGQPVHVLSGEDESRLTFLAARRWHGWAAGRLLVLDIGAGRSRSRRGSTRSPTSPCPSRSAPAARPWPSCPTTRPRPSTSRRCASTCARRSRPPSRGSPASRVRTTSSRRQDVPLARAARGHADGGGRP